MWALRRASLRFRNKNGFRLGTSETHLADTEVSLIHTPCRTGSFEISHLVPEASKSFYCTRPVCGNALLGQRGFSSKGTESEDEDDELVIEPGLSDEDGADETRHLRWKARTSELFNVIKDCEESSVREAVDKWVSEGNELTHEEVALALHLMKRLPMARKGLELMEYLEENDHYEYSEKSYGARVMLIAKVHGLKMAENYIQTIPDSYRQEYVYQALLAYCVLFDKMKKAEEVFQRMRDLGVRLTIFSCNQMIILYKRRDRRKLADVLELIERENLKPSLVTYKLLIAIKGQMNDTEGVEEILENMKSEGVDPDIQTRFIVGRHYARCWYKDKAESIVREMEGVGFEENRMARRSLITLYAALGKAEEVERVWRACESDPSFSECIAAMEAWGELGRVEEAEAVFNSMSKIWNVADNRKYATLLKVYSKNREFEKGEDLAKRMGESGVRVGPLALNGLVKLYVDAGEIEKADALLMKAAVENRNKPIPSTYYAVMRVYSRSGDVHNSERIFSCIKGAGHVVKWRQFEDLVTAYVNAKKPAYGMWERMKVENIFANRSLKEKLDQIDPFRKTHASYLLD